MPKSPKITPPYASPGMHVAIRCPSCRSPIEFFLRGGVNLLKCSHCHHATDIEVLRDGQGWAARES